jgi:hypothetical protein
LPKEGKSIKTDKIEYKSETTLLYFMQGNRNEILIDNISAIYDKDANEVDITAFVAKLKAQRTEKEPTQREAQAAEQAKPAKQEQVEQELVRQEPVKQEPVQQEVYQSEKPSTPPMQNAIGGTIYRYGKDYFLYGDDGKTPSKLNNYDEFLKVNCPLAYSAYSKGNRMYRRGVVLGIIGGAFMVPGIVLTAIEADDYNKYYGHDAELYIPGVTLLSVGSVMVAGSISLCVLGDLKKNSSVNIYNEQCRNRKTTAMNLSISPNAVGLVFKF